ncbi:MAG: hypothetical protein GY750_15445 [Lentisphaerae bacterium]|nr:hypothetical protein [Lentisphaerota bacterium]MCP4102793.1 hypothetical protein [Lentisphaerota bacterium]
MNRYTTVSSVILLLLCFLNIPLAVNSASISDQHPRLLINPEKLKFLQNEYVKDGDMEKSDCSEWANQGTPLLKEKADFLGSKRIHIIGGKSKGARQYLNLESGVEYEYFISVYLVSGIFKAQLYNSNGIKDICVHSTPQGKWKTFHGTFTATDTNTLLRFYGYDSDGDGEFYVDNISVSRARNNITDGAMSRSDYVCWESVGSPAIKEKAIFDGSRTLHVKCHRGKGVRQRLQLQTGKEYDYKFSVYLVNGECKAGIYENSGSPRFVEHITDTGEWKTITGSFVAPYGNNSLNFYAYNSDNRSEFYVDNVSITPSNNLVHDGNMSLQNRFCWKDCTTTTFSEKTIFN